MRWCNTKMREKEECNIVYTRRKVEVKIASYPEWPGYEANMKKNYCDIIMMLRCLA